MRRMAAPVHVRWCPQCEEEFRPEIARCSDCGGPLVDRQLDDTGRPIGAEGQTTVAPAAEAPAVPAGYRELTSVASANDLRAIGDSLDEASVPFHSMFDPDAPGQARNSLGGRFVVSVAESDRIAAIEAIRPHLGLEAGVGDTLAVERSYDEAGGYVRCPACGGEMTPGSDTCTECGLVVGGAPERD
jgi:hypothetical protein